MNPLIPKHLQGEARREWNRMSKQLFELDLLTQVDRAALAESASSLECEGELGTMLRELGW